MVRRVSCLDTPETFTHHSSAMVLANACGHHALADGAGWGILDNAIDAQMAPRADNAPCPPSCGGEGKTPELAVVNFNVSDGALPSARALRPRGVSQGRMEQQAQSSAAAVIGCAHHRTLAD